MRVGTKSVLFGVHQFLLHPIIVALAWTKLYGFPFDPRLWIAFIVHDLGYFGKKDMDGDAGERHVEFGAMIMRIFGKKWRTFSLYHSRFYAKRDNQHFSRLCVADKLATILMPDWLYLFLACLSGEIYEYMDRSVAKKGAKYASMNIWDKDPKQWYVNIQKYLMKWIEKHKNGALDTWTPSKKIKDK